MKTFLSCMHGPKFTYCRLHRQDIGSHLDARLNKRILFFSCLSTCRLNFQIQTTRGSVRCSSLEPYTLPDPLWALPMRDTLMSLLFSIYQAWSTFRGVDFNIVVVSPWYGTDADDNMTLQPPAAHHQETSWNKSPSCVGHVTFVLPVPTNLYCYSIFRYLISSNWIQSHHRGYCLLHRTQV